MQELKTLGISPKAVLAFLFPLVVALGVAVANWIVTGSFDADSVRAALAGLVTSGLALLGAYVGKPGNVAGVKAEGEEAVPEWPGGEASVHPDVESPADQRAALESQIAAAQAELVRLA